MTLHDSIEILTREHKTAAHTIDGLEIHTRPALLHLLREAVFGGMETTGGGSSLKSRLPISDAALDLYQLIDRQITEAWAEAHPNQVPGAGRPEALAAQWGALVTEDRIVTVTRPEQHEHDDGSPFVIAARFEYLAEQLARKWVTDIETFLDPPRHAQVSEPCLACGERYVHRRKDGETVQTAAFTFVRDRQTGETLRAECLACGAQWSKDKFNFLADAIGISVDSITAPKQPARERGHVLSERCADGDHDKCESITCKCPHHGHRDPVRPGKPTARKSGPAHTVLADTSTVLVPISRDVCTDCWTEKSMAGACMCMT